MTRVAAVVALTVGALAVVFAWQPMWVAAGVFVLVGVMAVASRPEEDAPGREATASRDVK